MTDKDKTETKKATEDGAHTELRRQERAADAPTRLQPRTTPPKADPGDDLDDLFNDMPV